MRNHLRITQRTVGTEALAPVRIGWLLDDPRAGVIFSDPACRDETPGAQRDSVETRVIDIPCPYDLRLQVTKDSNGQFGLGNLMGTQSPVRASILKQVLHVAPREHWRDRERLTLTLRLPYVFVSDAPVALSQVAPPLANTAAKRPGIMIGRRWPIQTLPQPFHWQFEWHDQKKPLELRRGETLFSLYVETQPPTCPFSLEAAARTPSLLSYLEQVRADSSDDWTDSARLARLAALRPRRLLPADE